MATFPADKRELTGAARAVGGFSQRGALLPWLLVLLLAGIGAFEWFYSPVEVALGRFMVWSAEVRPEAGRGWELNREGAEAMRSLDEMATTTRQRQSAGANLEGWGEVSTLLDSFQVFSISPDRFLNLYGDLPPTLQEMLVDPVELLKVRTGGKWQRAFFARERGRQFVYMVDPFNVVLLQGELTPTFFKMYDEFTHPLAASLADLEQFPALVQADEFFQVLAPSGPVVMNNTDLRWITGLAGRLVRVGLAAEPADGVWALAFESVREGRSSVHRYWVNAETGRQLFESLAAALAEEQEGEEL